MSKKEKIPDWSSLPRELLVSIFNHLEERKDILQCIVTCKNWSRTGEERICRDVVITKKSFATSFLQKIENSKYEIGNRVQSLYLGEIFNTTPVDASKWDSLNNFPRFVLLCPEIKVLSTADVNKVQLWYSLLFLHEAGHWKYIQEIPMPTSHFQLDGYFKAATCYRRTLTRLFLSERNFFIRHYENPFVEERTDLFKRLQEFPCLKHLEIKIETTRNNLCFVDPVIKNCSSSLSSLSLYLVDRGMLTKDKEERMTPQQQPSVNVLMEKNQHHNIQEIMGSGLQFNEKSIKYLIYKFPNLKKLTLEPYFDLECHFSAGIFRRLSSDSAALFASYVSNLLFVDILTALGIDDVVTMIGGFLGVVGTRTTVCIKYNNLDNTQDFFYPYLSINKSATKNTPAGSKKTISLMASFQTGANDRFLPHSIIIHQWGSYIKELILDLGNPPYICPVKRTVAQDKAVRLDILTGQSMAQIFQVCTTLDTLKLVMFNLCYLHYATRRTNESVKTLEIRHDSFFGWSEGLKKLSYCLRALKNVKFDIFPTTEDWDLHMETIEWEEMGVRADSRPKLIEIPMIHSELDNLTWKEKVIIGGNERSALIYIYVTETAGEKSYFFVDDDQRVNKITLQDYLFAFSSREVLCFEIQCRYLKSFTMEFRDLHARCDIH